jgi:prepilin signal peptidase PulO-like enzyme (type II secretory pathway)
LENGLVVEPTILTGAARSLSFSLEMTPAAAGATTLGATAVLCSAAIVSVRTYGIGNVYTIRGAFAICLASGSLAVASACIVPFGLPASVLLSLAFVNASTDIRFGVCFDSVQLLAASALALNRYADLGDAAAGLLVGAALLGVPYLLTRGRGIGLGDVKFAATVGIGLGVSGEIQALYAAFVAGGMAAVCMLVSGKADRKAAIAFAPFLSLGTVFALFGTRS